MLTNIAAAVHDKTSEKDTSTDVGLDIVWSSLFTASTKLIQVVLILATVLSNVPERVHISQAICLIVSILYGVWMLLYVFVVSRTCCYPKMITRRYRPYPMMDQHKAVAILAIEKWDAVQMTYRKAFQGVELVEEVRAGQMSMKQNKVLAKITKNSSMEIKRLALAAHAAEKQMKKFRLIAEKAPIESQKTTQMILSSVPWLPFFRSTGFLIVAIVNIYLFFTSTTTITIATPTVIPTIVWISMSILFTGIVVSIKARHCYRSTRVRHLQESGLTQALQELIQIEGQLFKNGAYDTEWQKNSNEKSRKKNSKDTNGISNTSDTMARSIWKKRICSMTSARSLASALIEFESHVLCENLHPEFYQKRDDWIYNVQNINIFSQSNNCNENEGVLKLLNVFKKHLRTLPQMSVIVRLIEKKMKNTVYYVPPQAVRRIMEYLGASSIHLLFGNHKYDDDKFKKYNESNTTYTFRDTTQKLSYRFPTDLKSTWTKGLYTHYRGPRPMYTDDGPVGSGAW